MEWVETTGRSVEEAKEAALDELGVDEADAEFEVVSEAQTGLFGRLRSEARVRARVRPTAPRPKEDRRDRRRRGAAPTSSNGNGDTPAVPADQSETAEDRPGPVGAAKEGAAEEGAGAGGASQGGTRRGRRRPGSADGPDVAAGGAEPSGSPSGADADQPRGDQPASEPRRNRGRSPAPARAAKDNDTNTTERAQGDNVEVALEEQARIAETFLRGLTDEFRLEATIRVVPADEDTIELQIDGPNLGLLIGQKGATLAAIQSIARTVVQQQTGATNGHLNVDVGGYRQKRTEALIRFAHQVAADVGRSGAPTAMEPMSALDRKIVHDAISSVAGVSTVSEGEEPRRRVVVIPSSQDD